MTSPSETIHASCVALNGQAVLITGASGSGKSGLALQLIALGADLVADDRTILTRREDALVASAPESIRGQIEARFLGILTASYAGPTHVRMIVDMDTPEEKRLPKHHQQEVLGVALPLIRHNKTPHFPASILVWLAGGRVD